MALRFWAMTLTVMTAFFGMNCSKKSNGLEPATSQVVSRRPYLLAGRSPQLLQMDYWYQNEELRWELTWDREFRFEGREFPEKVYWRAFDLETNEPLFGWLEVPAQTLETGKLVATKGSVLYRLLPRLRHARLDLTFDVASEAPSISYSLKSLCLDRPEAVHDHTRNTPQCLVRAAELPARTGDGTFTSPHNLEFFKTTPHSVEVCVHFRTSLQPRCVTGPATHVPQELKKLVDGTVVVDTTDTYPGAIIGTYGGTIYNQHEPMGYKLPIYALKVVQPMATAKRRLQISVPLLEETQPGHPNICGPEYLHTVEGELMNNGRLPMAIESSYRFAPECRSLLQDLVGCASGQRPCQEWETLLIRKRFRTAIQVGALQPAEIPSVTVVRVRSRFE